MAAHASFFASGAAEREFLRGLATERTEPLRPPLGFVAVRPDALAEAPVAAVAARVVPSAVAVTDILGDDPHAVARAIVAALLEPTDGPPVQRLFGCEGSVAMFESILAADHRHAVTEMRYRFMALGTLAEPPADGGAMEPLTLADADRVLAWAGAFAEETGVPGGFANEEVVLGRLERGSIVGWRKDGELVAVAQVIRPTPATETISFVWTPPEHRRQGFASRLVAALSRRILEAGRGAVLFIDAANPQTHRIYERLGYRAVAAYRSIAIE